MLDDHTTPLRDRVAVVIARMPIAVQDTVESQMALSLATEIDAGRQLSIAPVSKELRTIMEQLRAWSAEVAPVADPVDDQIAARRARREHLA